MRNKDYFANPSRQLVMYQQDEQAKQDVVGPTLSAAAALAKAKQPALSPDVISPGPSAFGAGDQTPTAAPTPATDSSASWLNSGGFHTAMGTIASAFAQTPGQMQAGQAITAYGQKTMDQERADAAAQKMGFGNAAEMEAAKAKLGMEKTKWEIETEKQRPGAIAAQTEETKAKATQLKESLQLIAPEAKVLEERAKLMQKQGDLLEVEKILNTPIDLKLDSGESIKVAYKDWASVKLQLHKVAENEINMPWVKQQAKDRESMYGETINIQGVKVPMSLLEHYMPAFTAKIKGEYDIQQQRISEQGRMAAARITANAAEGKSNDKVFADSIESVRKGIQAGQKTLQDNAPLAFKVVNGKPVLDPKYRQTAEDIAVQASVLVAKGAEPDRQLGMTVINNLVANNYVSEIDGKMLMQGIMPQTLLRPIQQKPAATPTPESAPAPPITITPSDVSRSVSGILSRGGLGVTESPRLEGGPVAIPDWMKMNLNEPVGNPADRIPGVSRVLKDYREQQKAIGGR